MHTRLLPLAWLLAGCLPPGGAFLEEVPLEQAAPPWEPFSSTEGLVLPVPGDVAAAALAAARTAGATPSPTGPGPAIGAVAQGTPWTWNIHYERPDTPAPVPVESFDLPLERMPWATIDGGELVVRWTSRWPTGRGVLYAGLRVEEDALAPPRYRRYRSEPLEGEATDHQVTYPVDKLLAPVYDVDGVRERGWGEVDWRIEVPDPIHGGARIYDGRTAFALVDGEVVQRPTVVLGPMVSLVQGDGAVIWFETDVPVAAAVAVGDQPPVVSTRVSTRHEIPVHGLEPGRVHVYQVAVSDGAHATLTPYNTVRTRHADAPVRLAVASDSRSGVGSGESAYQGVNAAVLRPLVADAARRGADAFVFPGDLADLFTTRPADYERQLRAWLHVVEGVHASVPFYTTMGNHDVLVDAWSDGLQADKQGEDAAEVRFSRVMVNPGGGPEPEPGGPPYGETAYGLDLGPVHVAVINTNYWWADPVDHPRLDGRGNREGNLMDGQLAWLQADLAAARERGARHLLVVGHEPAFPVAGHADDGMYWDGELPEIDAMRERFWGILAEQGVLAYVAGDEHNYSRTLIGPETVPSVARPVWQVVTGGCGAPYYALDPDVPWADRVQAFSAQQHYTLWTLHHDRVRLQAVGLTGEVIDDVWLGTSPMFPQP